MTQQQEDSRPLRNEDEPEFHLPEEHWPLPELLHTQPGHASPDNAAFLAAAAGEQYQSLRGTFRRFAFPMTMASLVSYFTYVLLSIYAEGFMAQPLLGALNVGMTLGLTQFAITWIWTAIYVRYAQRRLDPAASDLKAQLEGGMVA